MIWAGLELALLNAIVFAATPEMAPETTSAEVAEPTVPSTVHVCGAPKTKGTAIEMVPLLAPTVRPVAAETGERVSELLTLLPALIVTAETPVGLPLKIRLSMVKGASSVVVIVGPVAVEVLK